MRGIFRLANSCRAFQKSQNFNKSVNLAYSMPKYSISTLNINFEMSMKQTQLSTLSKANPEFVFFSNSFMLEQLECIAGCDDDVI
ncbi:hypothetical protein TTHERM_00077410 (macronuclear) [Tetrahymena thermophila SB210]|uniref:Uncharacterized protein n=1 Tax=Tetrahymena thermophila (strain SB210) TaxID=312017 RepID=Q23G23_TETTS|nr:hypothetical protein TTHERM_00077410 [Tetrahymena thermophila SB210]EAR95437.2 hypothetical protein TTHERM_00077410 [Tetrahymena thermophila SB210]|eukprot:XP_001015682.2 hypothetical protein TTHERM_00077410 [Tetrahymena thermophila SB210]